MRNQCAKIILVLVVATFGLKSGYGSEAWCQTADFQEGQKFQGSQQKRPGMQRIIQQLNLTDEQKEQLKSQRQKHKEQMQTMTQYLKEHRRKLKEELESPDADKNAINNIITEMKETEGRMLYLRTVGILETKEILTPEQFEKLQSLHKNAMQRVQNQKGRFMQRR
jgi:Spy/CpxP family protein refolding chaperone